MKHAHAMSTSAHINPPPDPASLETGDPYTKSSDEETSHHSTASSTPHSTSKVERQALSQSLMRTGFRGALSRGKCRLLQKLASRLSAAAKHTTLLMHIQQEHSVATCTEAFVRPAQF